MKKNLIKSIDSMAKGGYALTYLLTYLLTGLTPILQRKKGGFAFKQYSFLQVFSKRGGFKLGDLYG